METKVAIITGGGSGIGLATANVFKSKGWTVSVFDVDFSSDEAAGVLVDCDCQLVDVTDYDCLARAFETVFQKYERLDFVFGNAGVIGALNFFDKHKTTPPPALNQAIVDINLKAVISTAYLAQHYFRLNKICGIAPALVLTASTASLHPAPGFPMYAAVKHAVLGLGRSLAPLMRRNDKIRVSCICPGTMRTNLMEDWAGFPDDLFTPINNVVAAVVSLVGDPESIGKVLEVVGEESAEIPHVGFGTKSCKLLMEQLELYVLDSA